MTEVLWTCDEIVRATGGKAVPQAQWDVYGVSIDSRTLEKGDLFVAIKGENSDGHRFVDDALSKGAAAALVSERLSEDQPAVVVSDTLIALQALGTASRERADATRIAVTGSVGKTGTKDMLRAVLSVQAPTHASVASYNNHLGVPLTLARMPASTKFGVFELGMNHANEIRPLTKMVRPHISIITAIEPVHIEFFEGLEGIADAKAEIFEGMDSSGAAILNEDGNFFEHLKKRAQDVGVRDIFAFGSQSSAQSRLVNLQSASEGTVVEAEILGSPVTYTLNIPGRHIAMNSIAVLTAVRLAGADLQSAAGHLSNVQPREGRGRTHRIALPGGHVSLIDESYNANPASMASALRTLAGRKAEPSVRTLAVLGDMLELGENAEHYHKDLIHPITEMNVDRVYLAGPYMKHLWNGLDSSRKGAYADTAAELVEALNSDLQPGDIVMVKGSLGSGMKVIVDGVLAMDEGESS